MFSKRGIKFQIEGCEHPVYRVILVLRMLLLRDSDPKVWSRINQLMDHREDRLTKDRDTYDQLQREIVEYLRNDLQLADLWSEDEVQKCIGIIRINAINSSDHRGVKWEHLHFASQWAGRL